MTAEGDHRRAICERAEALCNLRRFPEAEQLAGDVIEADPNNLAAWCLLTRARMGRGDHEHARMAAMTAIGLAPENGLPFRLLSLCERKLGHMSESVAAAETAARLTPLSWNSQTVLAFALASLGGRDADAQAAAERALQLAPHKAVVHATAAKIHRDAGRDDEATQALKRVLAIDPEHPFALNELGRLQLHKASAESLATAGLHFESAVRSNPRFAVGAMNVDATIRLFLSQVATLTMFVACFVTQLNLRMHGPSAWPTWFIEILMLPPSVTFAWRYLSSVSRSLRGRLRRLITSRDAFLAPASVNGAAIMALVAASISPKSLGGLITTLAGLMAATASILYAQRGRKMGHPQPKTLTAQHARSMLCGVGLMTVLLVLSVDLAIIERPHFIGWLWAGLLGLLCAMTMRRMHRLRSRTRGAALATIP